MTNINKHYSSLDFDKILKMLADKCSCPDAAELALNLEPCSDLATVNMLIRQTSDAHMLSSRFSSPSFGGITSVSNSVSRARAGGALTMGELLKIAQVLSVIRRVRSWRTKAENIQTSLDQMFMSLTPNKFLEDKIKDSIISEDEIADSASAQLSIIRRKIKSSQSKIREQLDKMIRSATYQKYLQDNIITMRDGRFVVPVKSECRGSVPGLVHDTSSSGSTVFIEPMGVVEANNEIRILLSKEKDEIDRILAALSSDAGDFAEEISSSYQVLIQLDLIFAKAHLAYDMKASIPIMNDKCEIYLKKARHPLIDPKKVVPTNINLGIDFDTLVITGPNTGGKTVALKTIGLITLMAMCGMMIPAEDNSRLSVFDEVLADIGDEQSIEQSLSTFSAHMTNIQTIIKAANNKSLILLDELGAGTDPVEGAALAISILENLSQKGAKIASTTHYSELKGYALDTDRVENGCCEFDVATLRPTYKLLIGVPGRSNAFAISEKLGIPLEVIENAKLLVSNDKKTFEETVQKLDTYRQSIETQRKEISKMKAEIQLAHKMALEQKTHMEHEREKSIERARDEAKRIVSQAKIQADTLIEEIEILRKMKATEDASALANMAKKDLRDRIKQMDDIADPIKEKEYENYQLPRALKAGDTVLIFDIDKKGTVLKAADNKGLVEVQAGTMKTRVKVENLRLISNGNSKNTVSRKSRTMRNIAEKKASMEIDLRGHNIEEGILELDRFIDSCVLMNIGQITIIHGKGTGVLRSGIQMHLRKHPSVRTFRTGTYGEGENGVTIAELK